MHRGRAGRTRATGCDTTDVTYFFSKGYGEVRRQTLETVTRPVDSRCTQRGEASLGTNRVVGRLASVAVNSNAVHNRRYGRHYADLVADRAGRPIGCRGAFAPRLRRAAKVGSGQDGP